MDLHPDIAPLAFLLGTWSGEGSGEYPTIEPFTYREEVTFAHGGKPFLAYSQRTWHGETAAPLHAEVGYLRSSRVETGGEGSLMLEFVVAQPSGIIEIHAARFDPAVLNGAAGDDGAPTRADLELSLVTVHGSPTAKDVTDVKRTLTFTSDGHSVTHLAYRLSMAAVGHPLTHHLEATLARSVQ